MNAKQIAVCAMGTAAFSAMGFAQVTPDVFLARASTLVAQQAPIAEDRSFEGVIRQIDDEKKVVRLENSEGDSVSVRFDENTEYTLDGEESTREEALETGRSATASYSEDFVASKIDVRRAE